MKKFVELVLMMCVLISCLAGCGHTVCGRTVEEAPISAVELPKEPVHAVFVLGATANSPKVNTAAADDLIYQIASQGGSTVSVIVADGAPFLFDQIEVPPLDPTFSDSRNKRIVDQRIQEIITYTEEAVAASPHADYLGAIQMAARELSSYQDDFEKHILVFGSMLSDCNPLDFSQTCLDDIDAAKVPEQLKESANIPTLKGCHIKLYNVGDTAEPQTPLTEKEKQVLKDIWSGILELGGPASLEFPSDIPRSETYTNMPEVQPTPVVSEDCNFEKNPPDAIFFKEILFRPGTAELLNEAEAEQQVSRLAQYMQEHPSTDALLVGMTAGTGRDGPSIRLSYQRAEIFEKLLKKANVDPDRLDLIGTGQYSPFYEEDRDSDGTLNETLAQSNRAVAWIDKSSNLADRVLQDEDAEKFIFES